MLSMVRNLGLPSSRHPWKPAGTRPEEEVTHQWGLVPIPDPTSTSLSPRLGGPEQTPPWSPAVIGAHL